MANINAPTHGPISEKKLMVGTLLIRHLTLLSDLAAEYDISKGRIIIS